MVFDGELPKRCRIGRFTALWLPTGIRLLRSGRGGADTESHQVGTHRAASVEIPRRQGQPSPAVMSEARAARKGEPEDES